MYNSHKLIRSNVFHLSVLLLIIISFSCDESKDDGETTGGLIDGVYTIYAGNMYYNPANININQGDSIRFVNENGLHDVYITSGPEDLSLEPCNSPCTIGVLVFNVAGKYDYICSIGSHAAQGMIGTIVVNSLEN